MKKILIAIALGTVLFLFTDASLLGKNETKDTYLSVSFFFNPTYLGVKHRLSDSIYATGNVTYVAADKDLEFQFGAAYLIPRKIWIFRLYGGGGIQLSRNHYYQFPYVTVGSMVWILFWEMSHPLRRNYNPRYTFGFSFGF